MAFRKRLFEHQPEPTLGEAAERTRSLIRDLQARLGPEPAAPPPLEGSASQPVPDSPDDLDRQLQHYFEAAGEAGTTLQEIRNRVIEGVVDRILREWERPSQGNPSSLEHEAVARLIDRVLERLAKGGGD